MVSTGIVIDLELTRGQSPCALSSLMAKIRKIK